MSKPSKKLVAGYVPAEVAAAIDARANQLGWSKAKLIGTILTEWSEAGSPLTKTELAMLKGIQPNTPSAPSKKGKAARMFNNPGTRVVVV